MFGFPARQNREKRRTTGTKPRLEWLEDRMLLSTFRVNTTLDSVAVNFRNGKDATGHISLRSAIMAADARGGSNKIIVPAGTFLLSIAGPGEDDAATGDLDITGNLTIQGQSAAKTIIDGNELDRVFQVLNGKVSISKVTIQHGRVDGDGGGILNSGGQVTLSSVSILNNVVTGNNGTNGVSGSAGSSEGGTGSFGVGGGAGQGGGVFNAAGSLGISHSTIASNQAIGGDGGAGGAGGNGQGASGGPNSSGVQGIGGLGGGGGNGGPGEGGGLFNAPGTT